MHNNTITEGVESANIIRLLSQIVVKYFTDYKKKNPQSDSKTITYRTLFRDYIDHPVIGGFIKQLFNLLSKQGLNSSGVDYHRVSTWRSMADEQRGEGDSTNGGFDPDGLGISLFNFDTIDRTMTHELSHLYDYVVSKSERFDNRSVYKDPLDRDQSKRATFDEYYTQEMEVRARVMAEVAKYLDTWGADDLMKDISVVIRTVPEKLKKKYASLVYRIADAAKKGGIESITFVEKAPKVVPTTEEKLQKLFSDAGVQLNRRVGDDGKPRYTLDSGVLSVMSIDDAGDVSYPLLDSFMGFYAKNKAMRFVANNAYLSHVIRKTYGLNEYENTSGYKRSVIDDGPHFKHSKLKSDTIVPDGRQVSYITKKLAYGNSYYPASMLTKLMDAYKIPEHDMEFALNIIADAVKISINDTLAYQKKVEMTGVNYMTSPFRGVWVDSGIWSQIKDLVGDTYPTNRVTGERDGKEYIVLCGREDEISSYGTIIESNEFITFVKSFSDIDPVLVETICNAHNICMTEGWLGKGMATAALIGAGLVGGAHADGKTNNETHHNRPKRELSVGTFSIYNLTDEQRARYNERVQELITEYINAGMREMSAMRRAEMQARTEFMTRDRK